MQFKNMTDISPKVPIETHSPNKIPVFQMNSSLLGCFDQASISAASFKSLQSPALDSAEIKTNGSFFSSPHVLIADDDPFQAFYYSHLFQNSIIFDDLVIEKKDFQHTFFACGEELLTGYQKLLEGPMFIITDYQMGAKKMNGVDTILALRKLGYKGAIILRTSEKQSELKENHPELEKLLESQQISFLVDKSNHLKMKEIVHMLLKKMDDNQV